MNICNAINNERLQSLRKDLRRDRVSNGYFCLERYEKYDLVALNLAFCVVFKMTVAFEATLHDLTELLRKGIMIKKVMHSEARTRSFPRVSRANPFLRGSDAATDLVIMTTNNKLPYLEPPSSTSLRPSTIWWKSNTR